MQPRRSLVAALAAVALAVACGERGPVAVIQASAGPVTVAVEVAATDAARSQGLMYRRDIADGHGMIFVFPKEEEHSFWMKNTMIPLDLVFVAADGRIVGIHPDAAPLSLTPISVGRASKWVLEVPGGFIGRRGVAVGDRMQLQDVPSA